MTGHELKHARLALQMTQARLAEVLGVSVGSVARWEMPANRGPDGQDRYPVPLHIEKSIARITSYQP